MYLVQNTFRKQISKKLSITVENKNTVRIYYAYVCGVIRYVRGAFGTILLLIKLSILNT